MARLMPTAPLSIIFISLLLLPAADGEAPGGTAFPPAAALFIFGDSSVDAGNNKYIKTVPGHRADFLPYGQNGASGEPTGRFSNGRIVVDYIADYAKLQPVPPFLQPSSSFSHGANFAHGGAGILPETNPGMPISLQTQLQHFGEVHQILVRELGDAKAKEITSEAVYFISIGINDYYSYISNPETLTAYPPDEFVAMVVGNLTGVIQVLYDNGARKFGFLNLCPLGLMPAIKAKNVVASAVSELAAEHNKLLSAVLLSLAHIFRGFKYSSPDFYDWISERINHPAKYGFADGENACCGGGRYGGIYSCGRTEEVGEYELCENPDEFVWWDSFHVSERINEQFAKELWGGVHSSSPGMYNLKDLFFAEEAGRIGDEVDMGIRMAHGVDLQDDSIFGSMMRGI